MLLAAINLIGFEQQQQNYNCTNHTGQIIFSPASPLITFRAARIAMSSLVLIVADPRCGIKTVNIICTEW